jgi:probable O-glycosylation ligase (exosortase A-associated)
MILPLLCYQWQQAVKRHIRLGLMVMGFLVALAVLFTYSRGALLGLCAMGMVFWLRTRAKLASGLLILAVVIFAYNFAPAKWFDRMQTIETYHEDSSAMTRIFQWRVGLEIAKEYPILGGGFRATFWPARVNPLLRRAGIPEMTVGRAEHSIYFDALSEHGWIGLALFLTIGAISWCNCSWLIRRTRDRRDLNWANLLGRMGQCTLVGYWTAGTFASQAYLDEYWCAIFLFEAARRVVAKEIASSSGPLAIAAPIRLGVLKPGIGTAALTRSEVSLGYAKTPRKL